MTDYTPQQIVARGTRVEAETAADAIDNHPGLEGATYSILEEDEDKGVWRIDAFPTTDEEDASLMALLGEYDLKVSRDTLADADWLAMALSGLPPVRAGRFFIFVLHQYKQVDRIFFHENNGFWVGIVMFFLGFTLLGRPFVFWAPMTQQAQARSAKAIP